MMILKPSQLKAFRREKENRIISDCLEFLEVNNLSNSPNISSKQDAVEQVLAFAKAYDISKEMNIRTLLELHAKYGYLNQGKISNELERIMTVPSQEEDAKVDEFQKHLIFENSGKNE